MYFVVYKIMLAMRNNRQGSKQNDFVLLLLYMLKKDQTTYNIWQELQRVSTYIGIKVIPGEAGFRTDFFQIWNND